MDDVSPATSRSSKKDAKKGAYEYFLYEGLRVPATNLIPIPRKMSDMLPEEREQLMNTINRDIEYRKKHNLDSADITTGHIVNENGNVTIRRFK